LLSNGDVDKVLSIIELSFQLIDRAARKFNDVTLDESGVDESADQAIKELNQRFKDHAVGYQYAQGQLIRLDSEFLHEEVVKPALALLRGASFKGPEEEFRTAHKHYRDGKHKETITAALNAFESTIKCICNKRKWKFSDRATAGQLIEVIFEKELVPRSLESQFTSLRGVLASGLPTVRNRTTPSAHGQGSQPVDVPEHMSAYALNLAASNIVFLVESYKAMK